VSYLLDTNVISELAKPAPDPNVVAWTRAQSPLDLSLSVLTLGELEKGIARMPAGARRARLEQWVRIDLPQQFLARLLPVDAAVAAAWGELSGAGASGGRVLPVIDGLLLATAQTAGLTLVTRNVSDCCERGVPVYDPWSGVMHH
jgi:predicted nucleic acid-binding protein